jgi:prepilin-type N-terminal cleavage/methylation domain-containing protein
MSEKKTTRSGFTLIELMMTMAMTAIMIAVLLASLSGTKRSREVEGEANKVLAALREVQNYSLTGRGINGTNACRKFGIDVPESSNTLSITYYDKSSGTCTVVGTKATYAVGNGAALTSTLAVGSTLDFTLPNGQVFVNDGTTATELTSGSVMFHISKYSDTVFDNVCVYPFGRIEQLPVGVAACP